MLQIKTLGLNLLFWMTVGLIVDAIYLALISCTWPCNFLAYAHGWDDVMHQETILIPAWRLEVGPGDAGLYGLLFPIFLAFLAFIFPQFSKRVTQRTTRLKEIWGITAIIATLFCICAEIYLIQIEV